MRGDLKTRAGDRQDQPGSEQPVDHGSRPSPRRFDLVSLALIGGRILQLAYWLAAAAVAVQTISHVADVAIWGGDVFSLDADAEGNAFAWAGSSATFAAALMAFLPAIGPRAVDGAGVLLASIVAFFSLDDAIALHERIADSSVDALGTRVSLGRAIWPLVFMPLLAVAFVLLWRIARRGPWPVTRALVTGLALLAAAVLIEVTSALYLTGDDEKTWQDTIEVVVEEGAELGGWILIAGALAARAYLAARPSET